MSSVKILAVVEFQPVSAISGAGVSRNRLAPKAFDTDGKDAGALFSISRSEDLSADRRSDRTSYAEEGEHPGGVSGRATLAPVALW